MYQYIGTAHKIGKGLISKQFGLAIQSHINENETEVKVAKEMFPDCKDYLGVYEDAGLLGPRSLLAHSIFTTDDEYKRMASSGTSGKRIRYDLRFKYV